MNPMKLHLYPFALLIAVMASAQDSTPTPKRYIKVPEGYLMVLEQGDDILKQLENFAVAENIPSANFTGMGFVNMEFGFFNFSTKQYEPRKFNDVELASMQGTLAWQKGKVSIHAHGVVTDRNFEAHGGHILNGVVGTGTLEVMILVHDKKFERIKDEKKGYNVLCLENCEK